MIYTIIAIIFESFSSLFKSIDTFLNTRDLTLGAILAGVSPFIVLWIKISNEKGKKAKQMLIERRQLQIAFNVNEILEALKVESKWSLQEIGSTHMVQPVRKRLFSYLQAILTRRRVSKMKEYLLKLTSRRFLLAILAVIVPVVNEEFGLDLNTATIIAIIGGLASFIIGESHVDAKKVESGVGNVKPTINGSSDK